MEEKLVTESDEDFSLHPPCISYELMTRDTYSLLPLKHSPGEIDGILQTVQRKLNDVDKSSDVIKSRIDTMLNEIMSYKSKWSIYQTERNKIIREISIPFVTTQKQEEATVAKQKPVTTTLEDGDVAGDFVQAVTKQKYFDVEHKSTLGSDVADYSLTLTE